MGCGDRCLHSCKEIQIGSSILVLYVLYIVNDINAVVSNLRYWAMDGWFFILFADVAKYVNYNRTMERSGGARTQCRFELSNLLVSTENVFQTFKSYAKAVMGNKSVDMIGQIGKVLLEQKSVGGVGL
ncbi:hypothetical protein Tco_0748088 [Tanacetum coccineum]|uniref:Uncharacterized protein n=1 Tax=Tanacetum coccineum TaxID=301880 RepID=A0ABQ4YXC0_9ASTR